MIPLKTIGIKITGDNGSLSTLHYLVWLGSNRQVPVFNTIIKHPIGTGFELTLSTEKGWRFLSHLLH